MAYSRFLSNTEPVPVRRQMLEGREHLVVPTVMMTPGVRAGSDGPLLYIPEELGKTPQVWNYRPVTVYHPTLDGEGVSACDPAMIEQQKGGLIFNAQYDNKLKNDSWLDPYKLEKTEGGSKILDAVNSAQMLEVSTGLFYDLDEKPGVLDGKEYKGVVRNIRPDHLAILYDQVGACSINDGAGLLRNAATGDLSYNDIREQLYSLLSESGFLKENSFGYIADVYSDYAIVDKDGAAFKVGYKTRKDKVSLTDTEPEQVRRVTSYVLANNEYLHFDKSKFVMETLKKSVAGVVNSGDWDQWKIACGDSQIVFSKENKKILLPYARNGDRIILNTKTVKESNMSQPVQNAIHSGAVTLFQEQGAERRAEVGQLISAGRAHETQRPYLETLPETEFNAVRQFASALPMTPPVVPVSPVPLAPTVLPMAPAPAVTPPAVPPPAANAAVPFDVNTWLPNQPPPIQELVRNAMQQEQAVRDKCIAVINSRLPNVNQDWFKSKSTEMLKAMAMMANTPQPQQTQPTANYGGQAEVPFFLTPQNQQVQNANLDDEVLCLPSMPSFSNAG